MKRKLEREDQAEILKDLRSYGKYMSCWKNMKTSENNIPDIFFTSCLTGACVIELKRPGEEVEGGQLEVLKKLRRNGVRSFAVSGLSGYEKLKKHLGISVKNLKYAHIVNATDGEYADWVENNCVFK